MEQRNVPYVVLDRRIAGVDANLVGIDDFLAGKAIPAGKP
jgi:DNA-binding LacI/PurR family transcriptional regulator